MARDLSYVPTDEKMLDVRNRFIYHPPKDSQYERYEKIRDQFGKLAESLLEACPDSRELSLALTYLENAQFYSNAAIARNE